MPTHLPPPTRPPGFGRATDGLSRSAAPARPSVLDQLPGPPRRVVLVRALRLGDLLVAVPAFRALRDALPDAEISLVGLPWAAELVRRLAPYLDRFLEFPGFPGIKEGPDDPSRLVGFLADVQRHRFDLAVQMHGGGAYSNPFTRLLGARYTAGFATERDASGLDFGLPYVEGHHEVRRYLDLVEFLTGHRGDPRLEFPVWPEDRAELLRLGFDPRRGGYLVIHPGARSLNRRWMPERFAVVANAVAERLRLEVVVSGGPGEEGLVAEVARRLRRPPRPLPVERLGLGGLAALLEGAELVVANDTGAAHLADAVGTRSVVVYGSSDVASWQPLDSSRHRTLFAPMPCRPHACRPCPFDYRCLRAIGAEEAAAAALELLGEAGTASPRCRAGGARA